jgi:hypothetical protein
LKTMIKGDIQKHISNTAAPSTRINWKLEESCHTKRAFVLNAYIGS